MKQNLDFDTFRTLIRAGAVEKVTLLRLEGGGWFFLVTHKDPGTGADLCAARGGVRVFKTADAALRLLEGTGYDGRIEFLHIPAAAGQRPARAAGCPPDT